MGAGAVAASGLITLLKTMPTIVGALRSGAKEFGKGASKTAALRTDRDLPMSVVIFGSAVLVLLMFFFLTFNPVPGAQTTLLANFAASMLVVIFGFLFVTVASRIVGLIGSSASPVSGMTIATLMATCGDLPGQGLDGACIRRAGHHHRRRGLHRGFQCRRYFTGFEDGLSDRRDAVEAAARADDWRDCLHLRHRRDAERNEQGAGEVLRHIARPGTSPCLTKGCKVQQQHFQHARIHVIHADKTAGTPAAQTSDERDAGQYILLNALGLA